MRPWTKKLLCPPEQKSFAFHPGCLLAQSACEHMQSSLPALRTFVLIQKQYTFKWILDFKANTHRASDCGHRLIFLLLLLCKKRHIVDLLRLIKATPNNDNGKYIISNYGSYIQGKTLIILERLTVVFSLTVDCLFWCALLHLSCKAGQVTQGEMGVTYLTMNKRSFLTHKPEEEKGRCLSTRVTMKQKGSFSIRPSGHGTLAFMPIQNPQWNFWKIPPKCLSPKNCFYFFPFLFSKMKANWMQRPNTDCKWLVYSQSPKKLTQDVGHLQISVGHSPFCDLGVKKRCKMLENKNSSSSNFTAKLEMVFMFSKPQTFSCLTTRRWSNISRHPAQTSETFVATSSGSNFYYPNVCSPPPPPPPAP